MPTNTISAASFLDRLRLQTAPKHQQLESLPLSATLISASIAPSDYALYLKLMADVIYDTETNLFPKVQNTITDISDRHKLKALQLDLDKLQHPKSDFKSVFATDKDISLPFIMGILYVVEGSTLGGRYILKNIESALGYTESNGAQYFAGYGNKTGSNWKNFLGMLSSFETATDSAAEIISGANFAFDAIYKHLSSHDAYGN